MPPKTPQGRSSEGPGGPRRAPGGLIYSQLPQAGPNGWVTPISCALVPLTWYWAFFLRPSAQRAPFLAQNAPFRFYRGPRQPKWGPIKPNDPHPPTICSLNRYIPSEKIGPNCNCIRLSGSSIEPKTGILGQKGASWGTWPQKKGPIPGQSLW